MILKVGEPLLQFDRLMQLMRSLDNRSEIWINSTGAHLTDEKLEELMKTHLTGIMISLHSPNPREHDKFTGVEGSFDTACKALKLFAENGAFTVINCCASREMVMNGELERLFEIGKDLHCSYIQVIHPKSAGNWINEKQKSYQEKKEIDKLSFLHQKYNREKALLNYPSVSSQVFEESKDVFGCTAGGIDRFYVGASGEVQPCEFLNISFGNIYEEDFLTIFQRMRSYFPTGSSDWLCCTKAQEISELIKTHNVQSLPIPKDITEKWMQSWKKNEEPKVYKKLGIYKKS